MQVRILPILPLAFAIQRGAVEVYLAVMANLEADVVAGEEAFALGAETHFAKGPPLLERISRLKELELSPDGFWECRHAYLYCKPRQIPSGCARGGNLYCAVQPPSTASIAPVT